MLVTLTFILICIFLIESERLNYMPTAYLKLEQREIWRKNVDVFILFFLVVCGSFLVVCVFSFPFIPFMTPRELTPSDLSSSDLLKSVSCFFIFFSKV